MTIGTQVIEVSVPGPQGAQGQQGTQGPQGVGVPAGGQNGNILGFAGGATAWRNIVGTVSQSGGVPTGAVVERGNNANGDYVRFADGTQICWKEIDHSADAATTAIGSLFAAYSLTASFPASFSSAPAVFLTGRRSADAIIGGSLRASPGTASFTYNLWSATSLAASFTKLIEYVAVGRWF